MTPLKVFQRLRTKFKAPSWTPLPLNPPQFHHIVEACCTFMVKHLHSSNCISIWNYALTMSFKTLAQDTLGFTVRCIVDVADRGDILKLSADQMADVSCWFNTFTVLERVIVCVWRCKVFSMFSWINIIFFSFNFEFSVNVFSVCWFF